MLTLYYLSKGEPNRLGKPTFITYGGGGSPATFFIVQEDNDTILLEGTTDALILE